jgi:hypothetical protein
MSLDIEFNKEINLKKFYKLLDGKVSKVKVQELEDGIGEWVVDKYGNTTLLDVNKDKIFGLTAYGANNPTFLLDELVKAFNVMFIMDEDIELYEYQPEIYQNIDLFTPRMIYSGYMLNFDNEVIVPERDEKDYLPIDFKNYDA